MRLPGYSGFVNGAQEITNAADRLKRRQTRSSRIGLLIYAVLILGVTLKIHSMPNRLSYDPYFYSYLASGEDIRTFKLTPGLSPQWQTMPEDDVARSERFFTVKPLFIVLTRAASHAVGIVDSTFLVSTIAYFCLGWVVWLWLAELGVTGIWRLLAASALMASSVVTDTAREGTPDMLCTLLLTGGAWLLLSTRLKQAGPLLLLLAVFCRTDTLILAGLILLVATWRGRVSLPVFCGWSFVLLAGEMLVARRGYPYRQFMTATLETSYTNAFIHGLLKTEVAIYAPFVLLALIAIKMRFQRDLVFVCLGSWVIRYILWPHLEIRYLLPQAVLLGILSVAAVLRTEPSQV